MCEGEQAVGVARFCRVRDDAERNDDLSDDETGDDGNMIERCIQVGAADMLANTQHRERLLVRRVRYDTIRYEMLF